ncbi:MAG TPA: AI-2E family transporter [Terriglobales bacterium]|nr:AI-2E family transporter [Terriglobales bacterium]
MPLSLIDTRATRVLITVIFFTLVLAFLYLARHTLVVFLFAIFFAYLMDPGVSRVEKLVHGRRGLAIAIIYLLLVGLLSTLFFFVGPDLGRQAARFGEALPTLVDKIGSGDIARQLGVERGWSQQTIDQLRNFLISHRHDLLSLAQSVGIRIAEAAKNAWIIFLVPILAIFFLKDGRNFSEVFLHMVQTRPQREFVEGVLEDLNQMLAHFIRAQLTLAGLSLLAYTAYFEMLRVPYALVLGTAGGVMEFIPVVGPLVAALLIMSVTVLTYPHWLAVGLFLAAWRVIQDYVISPRIMGEKMELHPLAAIFGVLAGGEMAGMLGVYLSIPIMASLRIVVRRWRIYVEKKRFGPLNEYAFGTEIRPRK